MRSVLAGSMLLSACLAAGCFSANVDVGDFSGFSSGGSDTPREEIEEFYRGDFDDVYDAALAVAKDVVKIRERKREGDAGEHKGKIKGKNKDGTEVEFQLEEKGSRGVRVKIKVKGETGIAGRLHSRIRSRL